MKTSWRKLEELNKFVEVSSFENELILKVDPKALEVLAKEAMTFLIFSDPGTWNNFE